MGADRRVWSLVVLLLSVLTAQGQSILQRQVDVRAEHVRLAVALDLVARDGHFKLSYNTALLPGDSLVTLAVKGTVASALRSLLPPRVRWKESGEHVILQEVAGAQQRFIAQGQVFDAASGGPLARASIYEMDASRSVRSDADGGFSLEVSGLRERTALLVAKAGYNDTIVFVGRDGRTGRVLLHPRERLEHLEPRCLGDRCGVDDLGMARLLIPSTQMEAAQNLGGVARRRYQFSLIPGVGTNKGVSGAVVNNFSFNLVGGYARGLEGVEIGCAFNMERADVKGVQLAGAANLVGGSVNGVQVAGGVNHSMRSLEGLQISGGANIVWDTLAGVQVSGGVNIAKGRMRGVQVSGGCNVGLQDIYGTQITAGSNVCLRDVHKAQFAAGSNYARNVYGLQFAVGVNVATGLVGGGQIGISGNYARQVVGGQISCGLNIVADTVYGGQIGVVNFAGVARGGQVGLLNFSDTINGVSVGLLSVAWRGYHRFDVAHTDVLPLTLQFRTGTSGFYNLLSWSPPVGVDQRWAFGYGFGTEPRLSKRLFLNIEVSGEQVVEQLAWVDALNLLCRGNLYLGWDLTDHVLLSAGPTFHLLVSDWRAADGVYRSRLAPSELLVDRREDSVLVNGWLGFQAAVGVRF